MYSVGMVLYPNLAPRIAQATAALVSASPPALTMARRPSANDLACQYAHRPAAKQRKVYPKEFSSCSSNVLMSVLSERSTYSIILSSYFLAKSIVC